MILLAGSSDIDYSSSTLTDASRRAPPQNRGSRRRTSPPPKAACPRCGGLMVPSYAASLESDLTGRPMRLWRCVNCGECLDPCILANRWKGPAPKRPYERAGSGPRYARRSREKRPRDTNRHDAVSSSSP